MKVILARVVCIALVVVAASTLSRAEEAASAPRSFIVGPTSFLKDGKPFRIISGSLHYFRVHPSLWRDRMEKYKAAGLNTVQTYVPWNLHQPKNDTNFNYEGILDIRRFIQTAADVGLLVTVRPPPYICAEWEFGGFPSWFMTNPDIRFRTNEPIFMSALQTFMDDFLPRVADLQYQLGGPIIMFQIENEYGTYGSDWDYLTAIRQMFLQNNIGTILNTCNGDHDWQMTGGNLPGLFSPTYLRTINFGQGVNVTRELQVLRKFQPTGPLFVTEYWPGWFDEWGTKHETRPGPVDASQIDELLAAGGSVNMYMFHGGTNFGFLNGAEAGPYMPLVTSYDYDAPLSEAGDPTEKYVLIRNVIAKYTPVPDPIPKPSVKKAYGSVQLNFIGDLFDPRIYSIVSRKPVTSAYPKTMEELGESYGFVHYTAKLAFPPNEPLNLMLPTLHDAATVWLDADYQGSLLRDQNTTMTLTLSQTGAVIDILVENLGRINFGADMINEYKGLKSAQLERVFISGWQSTAIPLADEDVLRVANLTANTDGNFSPSASVPAFYVGYFNTPAPTADTFLSTPSWTKGAVWINGFNLGRYWCVGPQATLYVPAPVLRSDKPNQIILFDVYGTQPGASLSVEFVNTPQLSSRWC